MLEIDVPDDVVKDFEWVEAEKPYREFLIPAEVANGYGPPRLVSADDEGAAIAARFGFSSGGQDQ